MPDTYTVTDLGALGKIISRDSDGVTVPEDSANPDYVQYLADTAE